MLDARLFAENGPMPGTKSKPLPRGLPAHLSAGTEGYESLCTLLGITTTKLKQDVVNVPEVRRFLSANRDTVLRHGRTAERLRRSLLALYGDPRTRREVWRAHIDHVGSGENGKSPIPSLEHAALSAYDDAILAAEPDRERLTDCAEFYPNGPDDHRRHKPALAALPLIKDDFSDWEAVPDDRKPQVIAAAFAVASLLDDSRILHWAAGRESDIEHEYAFLNPEGTSEARPDAEPQARPTDITHELSAELRARVAALSQAASDLIATEATVALFDALTERHAQVLELREKVLAQTNAKAVGDLISEFAGLLEAKAEIAPWLAGEAERLVDDWRAAYPPAESDPEAVRADIDRAAAALDVSLPKAADAQTESDRAQAALEQHAAAAGPSLDDLQRRAVLSGDVAAAFRAVADAVGAVLTVLAPDTTQRGALQSPELIRPPDDHQEVRDPSVPRATGPEASAKAPEPTDTLAEPASRPDSSPGREEQAVRTPESPDSADGSTKGGMPDVEAPTDSAAIEAASDKNAKPADDVAPGPKASAPAVHPPTRIVDQPKAVNAHADDPREDTVAPISETETIADGALSPAQASLWRAVGDGRIGLAYHIARLDSASKDSGGQPSPELLAAVALGSVLGSPHDDLAHAFGGFVGPIGGLNFDDASASTRDALNLLLFVATLRPALFSAQQGASVPLLRRVELSGGLSPVYRLANTVADYAEQLKSVHLDVPTLSTMLDEGVWKDRIAAIKERAATWREGAAAATFLFAPAGYVWQHLLGKSGVLGELDRLLGSDRPAAVPRVREIAGLLDDRKAVHDLIHGIDQRRPERHSHAIDGRALAQLENRLEEPRALAYEWLRTMVARPGNAGFVENTVEALRRAIGELAPAALEAIRGLAPTPPSVPLANALECAGKAVESLIGLFESGGDAPAKAGVGAAQAISDDLLRVTSLHIDADGNIEEPQAPADILALLVDGGAHAPTFADAFDKRLDFGDLYGADAVCTRMLAEDDPLADDSRERLHQAIVASRASLQRQLYDLTERLEHAYALGEATEPDRAELTAKIGDATRRLEQDDRVLTIDRDILAIAEGIEPPLKRGIDKVKLQLNDYLPDITPHERELVKRAIEARDLATLHEQLDCLKRQQPLLSRRRADGARLSAFLSAADGIESALKGDSGPTHDALVQAVRSREDTLGLPFSALSSDQSRRSATLLEHWFHMARQGSTEPTLVASFFADLGLTLTATNVEPRGDTQAVIRAEPLRARDLCPAHAFGSGARGRYDIVFNWHAQAREPIIQALASGDPNVRTIVLYFRKLTRADREWLRRWSSEQSKQFITIDETLVLYLASLPREMLRALFDGTLPFTGTEPYFTAPGLVPPESFFGREGEQTRITDPYGSCFVYGGRQLGKTALLQAAQAAFHNPEERHLAEYVDLKARDVGIAEGAVHIWRVLWDVFTRLGVIDAGHTKPRGRSAWADNTVMAVRSWLDADEDGRILLLLDEADAFLNADLADDFPVSTRLKGLMDDTGRRFKVVLCGLHNVLRNTERANHPLAHFGEPVCVGPLLENGDLEQARALVREPMAAVGYIFEDENLITRILLWTNYYPSLIQLYGEALLRHLRQAPRREFPHTVTAQDVQAVFAKNQFRDFIRDRFSLTLQLDQRYEVIAYAMAVELRGQPDGLAIGLPSNRILELAREYWPDGFEIPEHEFRTLLQEMCGLGVLRQRSGDASSHYVFRNPNVLLLLGDADAILDVLYKKREKPVLFEASNFHAQYRNAKPESPRRGPLTYEQEALLKRGGRVAVICGVPAAKLVDVPGFLGERVEDRRRLLPVSMDANDLAGAINRLRPERETHICLVDEHAPWTLHWVERANEALRTAARGGALRVVFRAGPDELWSRFVADLPDEYLDTTNSFFDWVPLQPWSASFLKRWCSDLGRHEASAKIDDLFDLTGGWPLLLDQYAASGGTTWQARKAEVEGYIAANRAEILEALGLDTPARQQLGPLRGWDTLDPADVETYADLWSDRAHEHVDVGVLRRRLFWATQLGLVQDVGGAISFNPLVARVLDDSDA